MDAEVIAAMARWPDVPDVFGWLSLSVLGQWRLHPHEHKEVLPGQPDTGAPITNPQIVNFIGRNYTCDTLGRWFFQNGPQRVFVRLDGAPYILHTIGPALALETHTGLACTVRAFWLDDVGRLYAQTEHGPGLIAGRDLYGLLDRLYTSDDESLTTALEHHPGSHKPITIAQDPPRSGDSVVYLRRCLAKDIPELLGFVPDPQADPARHPA